MDDQKMTSEAQMFKESRTTEDIIKWFDSRASKYDQNNAKKKRIAPELIAKFVQKRAASINIEILDIGAGTGQVGEELWKLGYRTIDAHDGAKAMLEVAKSKDVYRNYFCEILAENTDSKTMPERQYDCVVSLGCFCPKFMNRNHLWSLTKLCKTGGQLFIGIRDVDITDDLLDGFKEMENLKKWKMKEKSIVPHYEFSADDLSKVNTGTFFLFDQEGSLCAQHALNVLLQGPYFSAVDLADIAARLDQREIEMLAAAGHDSPEYLRALQADSHNMDDSGYFSVQVISDALSVWNLDLVPFASASAQANRLNPTSCKAYICNHREHWFTIRKLGVQWFNLNSLLSGPQLISDTYLQLFLAQLQNEGYSIFVIEGALPESQADALLRVEPVDPTLAVRSANPTQQKMPYSMETTLANEDPELAHALALSLQESEERDQELSAAMEKSKIDLDSEDKSLSEVLGKSREQVEQEEMEKAIQLSLQNEGNVGASVKSPDPDQLRRQREAFLLKLTSQKQEESKEP